MPTFDALYTEFENTKDVCGFCEKYSDDNVATRFLLIRSLDKPNLVDIIKQYSDATPEGNVRNLTKIVYQSTATIDQLLAYIEGHRAALIEQRQAELEGLPEVLSSFPIVNCGVRNDKVDDIVKAFVRNKNLKSYEDLAAELDNSVLPKIRQYSLWSYYNQTSNDIIELFFLQHPSVIPTLRKIHDIDFFLKVEDEIIPFDLKFTHISEAYFDLVSQGVQKALAGPDDFSVAGDQESELKTMRRHYSAFRKSHPHLGFETASKLAKADIITVLNENGSQEDQTFVIEMQTKHKDYVPETSDDLHILEWWNYKYQGERLFCNNNRLFVFLAYYQRFVDGREHKGKTEEIGVKIKSMLDSLTLEHIHDIHYHYDKEASLERDYHAKSLSTIYSE